MCIIKFKNKPVLSGWKDLGFPVECFVLRIFESIQKKKVDETNHQPSACQKIKCNY